MLQTGILVLGVVENMSGLRQPLPAFKFYGPAGEDITAAVLEAAGAAAGGGDSAGITAETEVFHTSGGGAAGMAADMGVPFLGRVPMDGELSRAAEEGRSVFEGGRAAACTPALRRIIDGLMAALEAAPNGGGA